MNTKELINYARGNIDAIYLAGKNGAFGEWQPLFEKEPPESWICSGMSELTNNMYSWFEVELLEDLVIQCFQVKDFSIHSHSILAEKGKFASTAIVKLKYGWFYNEGSVPRTFETFGTATEVCTGIEYLKLATPKSFTSARMAAIRSIGKFFGKEINRNTENIPVTQIKSDVDEINSKLLKETIEAVNKAKTKDAALKIIKDAGFVPFHPELKPILETKN